MTFSFKPDAGTKTVHLAGEFNGWSMTATPMSGPDAEGRFAATLTLKSGRYEYKFVCDGARWTADPENPSPPGAYGNSVLFVGVAAETRAAGSPAATQPSDMAARVPHPSELVSEFENCCKRGMHADLLWFANYRMPWFTPGAVSFVYCDDLADAVRLTIDAPGARMGYDLERIGGGSRPWVVSLDRGPLEGNSVYTYEITGSDGAHRVIPDPHAWIATSRGGRAVSRLSPRMRDSGRIEVFPSFNPDFGESKLAARDIYVYLPASYGDTRTELFPVLYMHDGQNCWDDPVEPFGHGGWQINVTADRLIREGKIRPFIVVGIANSPQRMGEYGPGVDVCEAKDHAYINFVLEVKSFIDRTYRTHRDPSNTAIMGSSMGGLISFQAALLRPNVFGMSGVMSPAFWIKDGKGQGYDALVAKTAELARGSVKLYIDSGTAGRGEDGAADTRKMVELLRGAGWKDLMHFEDTGAEHNERAWRARVHRPLEFFFGRKELPGGPGV